MQGCPDEREVGGVGGQCGREFAVDRRGAHPHFEPRWAGGERVDVVGTAGFPRDQVEFDPMCLVRQRRNRLAVLVFGPVFDSVQGDRTASQHGMWLQGGDGQRGKRPALVLTRRPVADRFGGPSFACEHRV